MNAVDVSQAVGAPGVIAALTAADLELEPQPPSGNVRGPFPRPILAHDVVRYVGEPAAVVVAQTLAQAQDAEAVVVDLDPLPVVVGPEGALEHDAPILFPEVAPVPMETTRSWRSRPRTAATPERVWRAIRDARG
jgi:carbon-monoxide dehydrogenase large subunit